MSRLLAIDFGARRIGLAVADTATGSVVPLATLRRAADESVARALAHLARDQRIDELVVGLPLNMDGTEGEQALLTRDWAAAVADICGLPLVWRDERLTSVRAEAQAGPLSRGRSGGPPSAAVRNAHRARVDRLAAASIAQAELDARVERRLDDR